MKSVKLADGTILNNCQSMSSATEIFVLRDTYEEAGAIADSITPESVKHVIVYQDDGTIADEAFNLILLGTELRSQGQQIEVVIRSREKSEIEDLYDQVAELQEAILEVIG